jgi:hypothetical protein
LKATEASAQKISRAKALPEDIHLILNRAHSRVFLA